MTAPQTLSETQPLLPLREKIASIEVQVNKITSDGSSLTEADTERLIIEPLLYTLGYEEWQIRKRNQDKVTGKYPDYTILQGTQHVWFLEAKRLDHVLGDGEAEQAVNYANNQGAQWAVLTNGRSWYVYDAPARQPLTKKRVRQVTNIFRDENAVEVLDFLSFVSMTQGMTGASTETPHPVNLPPTLATNTEIAQAVENNHQGTVTPYTFEQLAIVKAIPAEERLAELVLQDGSHIPVKTWLDVFMQSVILMCERHGLPTMPFSEKDGQKQCFLNSKPVHPSDDPMWNRPLNISGNIIYMHWRGPSSIPRSAKRVASLMAKLGVSPEAIQVLVHQIAPSTQSPPHQGQ